MTCPTIREQTISIDNASKTYVVEENTYLNQVFASHALTTPRLDQATFPAFLRYAVLDKFLILMVIAVIAQFACDQAP